MSKKKELIPHASPSYWLDILVDEFKGESDRACVILAATLLDSALDSLLRSRLAPIATSSDSLFDGANAPLASFSARIDMSHRLGLISPQFARDLHIIRRIRNDFAHNISGCTFEDSSVRDRVIALGCSSGTSNCHESWLGKLGNTPKGQFELILTWMLWNLREQVSDTESIPLAEVEWGYNKDWSVSLEREDEDGDKNT